MFVDGIDKDITSDVTTRIVYVALAEFTSEMIARFPEFRRGPNATVAKRVQMWDPLALSWTTRTVNVPSVNGAPLLLIPRGWGRPQLMMSAQRYYATSLLSYVQVEQAITTSRGKVLYLPKGQLRAQPALAPSRRTNVAVTRRAIEKSDDLVEVFKRFVLSKYERVERESLAG
ncbi:hypothetical protein [Rhodococcus sp. MEB041]|uniref:hypothetical protein n=1 Tax=Rhodococcus sp. MEB041 TaxID=3040323 RepID=UPI00255093DA|nr:hypothetical protein [Rhodococcus sp. MEB041]